MKKDPTQQRLDVLVDYYEPAVILDNDTPAQAIAFYEKAAQIFLGYAADVKKLKDEGKI